MSSELLDFYSQQRRYDTNNQWRQQQLTAQLQTQDRALEQQDRKNFISNMRNMVSIVNDKDGLWPDSVKLQQINRIIDLQNKQFKDDAPYITMDQMRGSQKSIKASAGRIQNAINLYEQDKMSSGDLLGAMMSNMDDVGDVIQLWSKFTKTEIPKTFEAGLAGAPIGDAGQPQVEALLSRAERLQTVTQKATPASLGREQVGRELAQQFLSGELPYNQYLQQLKQLEATTPQVQSALVRPEVAQITAKGALEREQLKTGVKSSIAQLRIDSAEKLANEKRASEQQLAKLDVKTRLQVSKIQAAKSIEISKSKMAAQTLKSDLDLKNSFDKTVFVKDALLAASQYARMGEFKQLFTQEMKKPAAKRNFFILDNGLITILRIMMDTKSSVREEEFSRIPKGQSLLNRLVGIIAKTVTGGERLTFDDRIVIMEGSDAIMKGATAQYNDIADSYRTKAQKEGLDAAFIAPRMSETGKLDIQQSKQQQIDRMLGF